MYGETQTFEEVLREKHILTYVGTHTFADIERDTNTSR